MGKAGDRRMRTPDIQCAKPEHPLTRRRSAFVREFAVDLNATQAAIRAGFAARTARQAGSRLLSNVDVAAAIRADLDARAARTEITADRVLEEVALLAFSDLSHYVVTATGEVGLAAGAPAGAMRAVQSIRRRITTRGRGEDVTTTREVEIRLWEKPSLLKLAGQHVGLFSDKPEERGKVTLEQLVAASRLPEFDHA